MTEGLSPRISSARWDMVSRRLARLENKQGGSGGATNLNGLTDVVISSPSSGQALKYTGTEWVNDTVSASFPLTATQAGASTSSYATRVTGDTQDRHYMVADGSHWWGPGNATVDTSLYRSAANTLKTDDTFIAATAMETPFITLTEPGTDIRIPASSPTGLFLKDDGTWAAPGGGVTWPLTDVSSAGNIVEYRTRRSAKTQYEFQIETQGALRWGDGDNTDDTNLYRPAANILKTDDKFAAGTSMETPFILLTDATPDLRIPASSPTGLFLKDDGTWAAPSGASFPLSDDDASATTVAYSTKQTGDSNNRFEMQYGGTLKWGPGNAITDLTLARSGASTLTLTGSFAAGTIESTGDLGGSTLYEGGVALSSIYIANTLVNAKGDLIVATADNTVSRLASSGVNDQVLTVDTSTATGLKWAAAPGGSVTWPLAGPADSNTAPNYSWSGDTQTGIYRIGAGNIGIASSGTNVVDIGSSLSLWKNQLIVRPRSGYTIGPLFTVLGSAQNVAPSTSGDLTFVNVGGNVVPSTTTAPTNVYGLNFYPNVNAGSLGATAYAALTALRIEPSINHTVTTAIAAQIGFSSFSSGNVTTAYGTNIDISPAGGGTFTTTIGLRIASLIGTTTWGMQIGDFQSQHQGKLGIGGAAVNTAPTSRLHVTEQTIGQEVFRVESVATNDDPALRVVQARATTTDATVTNLWTMAVPASATLQCTAFVVARRSSGGAEGAAYIVHCGARDNAGTRALIATNAVATAEVTTAWNAVFDVSGTDVRLRVTGAAANNLTWHATIFVAQVAS